MFQFISNLNECVQSKHKMYKRDDNTRDKAECLNTCLIVTCKTKSFRIRSHHDNNAIVLRKTFIFQHKLY